MPAADWRVAADTTANNTAADFNGRGALARLSTVSYTVLDTNLAGLIDGKVEQYYQTTDPSSGWDSDTCQTHLGDLWYHPTNKVLIWVKGDPDTSGTTEEYC